MKLNTFLRECISNNVDFSRINFVRKKYCHIWEKYFEIDVPVKFTKRGHNEFAVSGRSNRWKCNENSGDCELLSITVSHKGIFVILGDGTY